MTALLPEEAVMDPLGEVGLPVVAAAAVVEDADPELLPDPVDEQPAACGRETPALCVFPS